MLARPLLALVLPVMLAAAPAALAQTPAADAPVTTAAHKAPASSQTLAAPPPPAPPARPMTTDEQIAAYLAASPALGLEPGAPIDILGAAAPGETSKRRVHGSVGATVGTGGYRSAYASALIPLGETGTLGLAVSQTDFGDNLVHGPGYGYGQGYDHGYGYGYGEGRWAARGGRQSSLALSLALGGDRDLTPQGCAPGGFRESDGGYVEPLWVGRMRGDARPCDGRATR